MRLISLGAVVMALTVPIHAQSKEGVEIFSGQSVASQLSSLEMEAKAHGSGGATLGDYGSHAIKLSVRTRSGGAEIHEHFDDIFIVTDGSATLITGGTVLNAKAGSDGETQGSGIQNGNSHRIAKGDVVHIPAGTPHQLIITPGEGFSTIVVKVKE